MLEAVWKTVKSTLQLSEYQMQSNDTSKQYDIQLASLNEKKNDLLKERDCVSEEKNKIINAIKNTSLSSIIRELEIDYINTERREKVLNSNLDNINRMISEIREKQNQLQNIVTSRNLDKMTPEEKRDIYIRELDSITYYSVTTARGFIVLNFKNGIQNILAIKKKSGRFIAQLPASFTFNTKKRTITVPVHNMQKMNVGYMLPQTELKEYTFQELETSFDLSKWNLGII